MDPIQKINLVKKALAEAGRLVPETADPLTRRYAPEAVNFLRLALQRAADHFDKSDPQLPENRRHLSGAEVLEGVRLVGLELFGPLAPLVFAQWGVHRTEDWGEIVFLLVEAGLLKKTDRDSRSDFAHGYPFESAFRPDDYWHDAPFDSFTLAPWDPETPPPDGDPC
jgi:uncharacterized repeat protein (TIGR04138 family)